MRKICKYIKCENFFDSKIRNKKYCCVSCSDKAKYKRSLILARERNKKRKEERNSLTKIDKIKYSLTQNNCLYVLKLNNKLDKACKVSNIPRYYLEKYGVNELQLEKLKKSIS